MSERKTMPGEHIVASMKMVRGHDETGHAADYVEVELRPGDHSQRCVTWRYLRGDVPAPRLGDTYTVCIERAS